MSRPLKADPAEIVALRQLGFTLSAIGDMQGITKQAVYYHLKRNSIRENGVMRRYRHPKTCPVCQKLVEAPPGLFYHPECHQIHNSERVTAYVRKLNEKSRPNAVSHRHRWTPAEDAALIFRTESLEVLAPRLGRTYSAVKNRLHVLARQTVS